MLLQRQHLFFAMSCVACTLLGAHALAAQNLSSPNSNQTLVVWKAGSPASNQVPDNGVPTNLERKAESMGLRLEVHAFAGSEFAQQLRNAFAAHAEPDIIAIENAASIEGPPSSPRVGIASDPAELSSLVQVNGSLKELAGERGGRQFLISTSEHAEAARRFALRPPECDTSIVAETQVPPDLEQATIRMNDAYLRTPLQLKEYEDADRLTTEGVRWDSVNVRETRTCGSWGNDRLAFVFLVSTFDHEDFAGQPPPRSLAHGPLIGQMPVLLVLRKQDGQWRLLVACSDPWSTEPFLRQVPVFSGLLREPSAKEAGVAPAQLLLPEDGKAPLPVQGEHFGVFIWQPSSSGNVVAQIAEFAYENDDRLFFMPVKDSKAPDLISAGSLWKTESEWKWRVWSITDSGTVVLSEYRTFRQ